MKTEEWNSPVIFITKKENNFTHLRNFINFRKIKRTALAQYCMELTTKKRMLKVFQHLLKIPRNNAE